LAELNPSDCAYLLFEASRYLPEEASAACLPLAADAVHVRGSGVRILDRPGVLP
jgi:hypothetical protein